MLSQSNDTLYGRPEYIVSRHFLRITRHHDNKDNRFPEIQINFADILPDNFGEYQEADKAIEANLFTFVANTPLPQKTPDAAAESKSADTLPDLDSILEEIKNAYIAGKVEEGNKTAEKLLAIANAAEKSPQQAQARCLLTKLYFFNVHGTFKQSTANITQFFASHNLTDESCKKWLEDMPTNAEALATLGGIHYQDNPEKLSDDKRYEKATTLYRETLKQGAHQHIHYPLAIIYLKKSELLAGFLHMRTYFSIFNLSANVPFKHTELDLANLIITTGGRIADLFFTKQDKDNLVQQLRTLAQLDDKTIFNEVYGKACFLLGVFYLTGWVVDEISEVCTYAYFTQALALGCEENAAKMENFVTKHMYSMLQAALPATPISTASAGFVNKIGGTPTSVPTDQKNENSAEKVVDGAKVESPPSDQPPASPVARPGQS